MNGTLAMKHNASAAPWHCDRKGAFSALSLESNHRGLQDACEMAQFNVTTAQATLAFLTSMNRAAFYGWFLLLCMFYYTQKGISLAGNIYLGSSHGGDLFKTVMGVYIYFCLYSLRAAFKHSDVNPDISLLPLHLNGAPVCPNW